MVARALVDDEHLVGQVDDDQQVGDLDLLDARVGQLRGHAGAGPATSAAGWSTGAGSAGAGADCAAVAAEGVVPPARAEDVALSAAVFSGMRRQVRTSRTPATTQAATQAQ